MNLPRTPDHRRRELELWLAGVLGRAPARLAPASADASFRRYFRAWHDGATFVVMDAPPDREQLGPYLQVADLLARAGVHVPEVLAADRARGFLLLGDLGDRQYLDELRGGGDAGRLYSDALDALVTMQSRAPADAGSLPLYDRRRLCEEMELFPQWFLSRHLGLEEDVARRAMLDATFSLLADEALAQPQVLVHRDFHSRNLMVCVPRNPGVLDFQDAVIGAVTYDLVSLLKDCYIAWPRDRVLGWLDDYRTRAAAAGIALDRDRGRFIRSFDLMGLQRHLKVLGIFARLWYRDGKPGYLVDLPLVLDYALAVTGQYPELAALDGLLREAVLPAFATAQRRATAAP